MIQATRGIVFGFVVAPPHEEREGRETEGERRIFMWKIFFDTAKEGLEKKNTGQNSETEQTRCAN